MKKLFYTLLLFSAPVLAQNNIQGNANDPPPQAPQQVNEMVSNTDGNDLAPVNVNPDNNINVNDNNSFHPFQGNKFQANQVKENNEDGEDNNSNKDVNKKGKDGKPYCKECEEIEKLKKQHLQEHYSSDAYGQKKRNHYVRHIRFFTTKKIRKVFGKKKKARPNYSCFAW
jgi:hypothetical protein